MSRLFFIAGCARSGTTLLQQLMPSFKEMHTLKKEANFDYFAQMDLNVANLLLKRDRKGHLTLPDLPADINLIYSVRHPFDTLTSHHPKFPHRRFYVSEKRWRTEYAALRELRARHPERTITYVRYCDLVTSPDAVQRHLANKLGLEIESLFSQSNITFSTRSIKKHENDPDLERYLWLLPHGLRQELEEFCDEFGYELPDGYVQPSSFIGDSMRRVVVPIRARIWSVVLLTAGSRIARKFKPLLRQPRRSLSRILPRPNRAGTGAPPLGK
jgi:hypothetical protein